MILVADSGPLRYLVLIECVDVLRPLYNRAVVPMSVALELQRHSTPAAVRKWMAQLPSWCDIHADPPADPELEALGLGERSAIQLAESIHADRLLMDDRHRLLDFEEALARLGQTNFYLSADLVESVRRQLSGGDF